MTGKELMGTGCRMGAGGVAGAERAVLRATVLPAPEAEGFEFAKSVISLTVAAARNSLVKRAGTKPLSAPQ